MTKSDDAGIAAKKTAKLPSFLDDCDRPACDDMVTMLKAASDRVHASEQVTVNVNAEEKTQRGVGTLNPQSPCPPKSAELGRSSWTLLHTLVSTPGLDVLQQG